MSTEPLSEGQGKVLIGSSPSSLSVVNLLVGWLKKGYVDCPKCGRMNVMTPWSLPRARERRFWGTILLICLAAGIVFGAAALVSHRSWPWLLAGPSLAFAALLMVGYRRSLTIYRCLDCRHRWTL